MGTLCRRRVCSPIRLVTNLGFLNGTNSVVFVEQYRRNDCSIIYGTTWCGQNETPKWLLYGSNTGSERSRWPAITSTRVGEAGTKALQRNFSNIRVRKLHIFLLVHLRVNCDLNSEVYKVEGWRALFKGLGPNLSGVIPARSVPPLPCTSIQCWRFAYKQIDQLLHIWKWETIDRRILQQWKAGCHLGSPICRRCRRHCNFYSYQPDLACQDPPPARQGSSGYRR